VDIGVAVAGGRAGEVKPAVKPAPASGVCRAEFAGCAVDHPGAADAPAKAGFGGVDDLEPGVVPGAGTGRSEGGCIGDWRLSIVDCRLLIVD